MTTSNSELSPLSVTSTTDSAAEMPPGLSRYALSAMTCGWFVGAFTPTALDTDVVEVAVQHFPADYRGRAHHHRIATEVTLLLAGEARMGGVLLGPGDILRVEPGVSTTFDALTPCVTVVVKLPGALNDKYDDEEGVC
ncbi:cupin domain-containing protein [Lelliottia nimipressuralis]